MSFNSKEVGDRIYLKRVSLRMTQQDLADAIGVSSQTIGNYEEGKTSPDLDKAWEIADFFGLSLDEMFGRKIPA